MDTFAHHFAALMEERYDNAFAFSKASGASSSYLTDIFKHGKLPTPDVLQKWLEKAGFIQSDIDKLLFLLRVERLGKDEELAPLLAYFNTRITILSRLVADIARLSQQHGVQLPGDLLQAVKGLESGLHRDE